MIELVIVYCLSTDQTQCIEKRDPTAEYGDAMACMMSAEVSAQQYLEEHPKWRLSRWKCGVNVPRQLPA